MRLLHCSDIHLDSKLETNFTPQLARQRNHEICLTFERMVHFAQNNSVNAILLCGDIFDTNRISQTTLRFVLDMIRKSNSIQFFYLRGNHDECTLLNYAEIPQNLMLFSNKWQYFRCKDLVVAGIEIDEINAETLYEDLSLEPNQKNIVMMHGQVDSACGTHKVNLSRLSGKNIDYLALGHIHAYQLKKLDHRGVYCYSGCLEGRGFDETGEKGFVLLDIDNHSIHSRFIPFAYRQFHKVEIDISKYSRITEILNDLRTICAEISSEDFLQITLNGRNISGVPLDINFLEDMLSSTFYYVKIYDESFLDFETTFAEGQISLRNEFIKSVNADSTLSETDRNVILKIGLSAISNEESYV